MSGSGIDMVVQLPKTRMECKKTYLQRLPLFII